MTSPPDGLPLVSGARGAPGGQAVDDAGRLDARDARVADHADDVDQAFQAGQADRGNHADHADQAENDHAAVAEDAEDAVGVAPHREHVQRGFPARPMRVAILAPTGADTRNAVMLLAEAGLQTVVMGSVGELAERVAERVADELSEAPARAQARHADQGPLGAVLITTEALAPPALAALRAALAAQPIWSDLPLVLLMPQRSAALRQSVLPELVAELGGNTLVLERPLSRASLVSAVHSALRARERQFQLRDRMDELAAARETIAQAANSLETLVQLRTAERDEIQDRLRQSQKMEALGQLVGGIAHDFNNMLQGISGSLDVLNKRVATGSTEGMQRTIDSGRRSADRAAALVQRLLAFARRQPLKTSAVPLNQLVTSMRDLLRQSLGDTIVLALDLDPTTPRASCDTNQLENAILNLVINARDAMPQGGTVTVRTSTVDALVDTTSGAPLDMGEASAARSRDGGYSIVEVEDTGTGMPAEVRMRAFDPFFTTKPMGKGTGLGLSMIYGFAKQSGGACDIQSEPGQGTRVRLILPAAPSRDGEREVVPAAASRPSPRRGRLLVVEDDDVVRGLVVEALQDLGFEVHQAADGAVAMRMLDGPLDLLVTDIGLPGASGVEVAESARRNHPQIPVLFMTGYNRDGAGTAPVLGAGMSLISKPFDMAVLAARVSEMVGQ